MRESPLPATGAPRRDCPANRERLVQARHCFDDALAQSVVSGFFGEVRMRVTFQDGVIQGVTVERSQTLR